MSPLGTYFINGKDFWNIFGVIVESGKDDFLKYPSKKDAITRNWSDANGLDVDLSTKYFNARDIVFKCALLANSNEDFWIRYRAFIAEWMLPGFTRIQVRELGMRSYYCEYKSAETFDTFTRIRIEESGEVKIACKFTITFTELEPTLDNSDVFLVDEDCRHIIT